MKTTVACIIFCLCSLSVALQTVYVGDFIYPPAATYNYQGSAKHYMLYDGFAQSNYLMHSMANGKGIQLKFADEARKTFTGTLLLKNSDGTYRGVDLPFNCSKNNYATSATYGGQVFVCGSQIFSLGPDGSIQNLQTLSNDVKLIVFANSSVFMETYLGSLNVWSNIPENPTWTVVGGTSCYINLQYPQIYTNHAIVPYVDGKSAQLFRRTDFAWDQLEIVTLNFTGDSARDPAVLWDGADTIISGWRPEDVGVNTVRGQIKIFRKVSGSWSLNKTITSTDLGLAPPGGLGVRLLLIDANTVLVHAVEGYNRTRAMTGGASFALEKINNDWVVTTKFVQQNPNDAYLLGAMSYDKSDRRLYFTACRTVFEGRLSGRECGIKYAVWNRT